MKKMISEFKIGYWYKWTGKYYTGTYLCFFTDGEWHKCVYSNTTNHAQFDDIKTGISWSDIGMSKWIESKYSPKEKVRKLLNENRR
jgi:hypothetical protein